MVVIVTAVVSELDLAALSVRLGALVRGDGDGKPEVVATVVMEDVAPMGNPLVVVAAIGVVLS